MTKKPDSTVIRFIREVWDTKAKGGSWQRFNSRVRNALVICAEGFAWESGDLDRLPELFRTGSYSSIVRCLGESGYEGLYTDAIRAGNMSYCLEYERYELREPIIADEVTHGRWHTIVRRNRDRLCIGSRFEWNGEEVHVTSFNKAGLAVACSYQVVTKGTICLKCGCCTSSDKETILHRYTISAADVKADRKRKIERRV